MPGVQNEKAHESRMSLSIAKFDEKEQQDFFSNNREERHDS
jgi:hypothetical protein